MTDVAASAFGHFCQFRANSLEVALQQTQKELSEERVKFQKLKEDFKYNLRLLADRDAELEKYDSSSTGN